MGMEEQSGLYEGNLPAFSILFILCSRSRVSQPARPGIQSGQSEHTIGVITHLTCIRPRCQLPPTVPLCRSQFSDEAWGDVS
jgi:hypothetical protein